MLCQFTFQNFKSYKNETTLDYQAAVLPEFKNTLITETSASDLLPVNVVYGPNGGGKSNLLQALACRSLPRWSAPPPAGDETGFHPPAEN